MGFNVLPAIKTEYNGITFRSKLEARYAKAFDRLGIVWEYEGHGFEFQDGLRYCPDFYMPEIDTYFEVKGQMDKKSIEKVLQLSYMGKTIAVGHPDGSIWVLAKDYGVDTCGEIIVCDLCGKARFSPEFVTLTCGNCDADWKRGTRSKNVFEAAGWTYGQ